MQWRLATFAKQRNMPGGLGLSAASHPAGKLASRFRCTGNPLPTRCPMPSFRHWLLDLLARGLSDGRINIPLRWQLGWLASLLISIGASPAEAEIVNYLLPV